MRLSEAIKCLEEGKKVRKTDWINTCYLHLVGKRLMDEEGGYYDLYSNCFYYDWEIYEEPEKTYSFMEAVQLVKEGKTVTRRDYVGCKLRESHFYINKIEDIEANDWIVCD